MSDSEQKDFRTIPQSDTDYYMLTTETVWGKDEIPSGLKDRLTQQFVVNDQNGLPMKNNFGQVYVRESSLWNLLAMYNRDLRLANLSEWNNELNVCRYYLDLSADFLNCGMINPFMISLSRVATIIETSQSKNGFLRRMLNTLRHESTTQNLEPPKKGLFGKGDKGGY
jgi:hypothetical protein